MNLLSLTYDQLVDQFRLRYGRGAYHATALYRNFYSSNQLDLKRIPEFSGSGSFAAEIARDLDLSRPELTDQVEADGVSKLQLRLVDGLAVETVLIPMANHTTCASQARWAAAWGAAL